MTVLVRKTILEEAREITDGARRQEYGTMEDSFASVAEMWTAYLRYKPGDKAALCEKDVAMMMVLMKVAREQNAHKRDNLVDLAGYARCASVLCGDEVSLTISKEASQQHQISIDGMRFGPPKDEASYFSGLDV